MDVACERNKRRLPVTGARNAGVVGRGRGFALSSVGVDSAGGGAADGNALAEQLHAWRQACQDHGIQPTPEALRAVLRRVDAACVAEADL